MIVQDMPVWMLLWLMIGLPLFVLLVMYLRKKNKIGRTVGAFLSIIGLSGSIAWSEGFWSFVFFTLLFLPVGYASMFIAESYGKKASMSPTNCSRPASSHFTEENRS